MSSVREIASQVGVSVATVSRVINNDPSVSDTLRQRVLKVANQTRYVPKVGVKTTTNVALLYTDEPTLDSPFDAALLKGMGERMDEFKFDLLILRQPEPGANGLYTQTLMRKGVRGVVLRTTARTHRDSEQIATEGFPAVVVGDRFDNPDVSFVSSDSRSSSRDAVQHLLNLGHRRIAISTNVVDDCDHQDRVLGYRDAMAGAGLTVDERLVVRTPANRDGGVQIARRLLVGADRPTAMYVADPTSAIGAIYEAIKMGLDVPGDLSVVGFDDAELRFLIRPTMTAVCQDAAEIGREAFAMLHDMIVSPKRLPARRRVLPTTLQIHGSTSPPRKPTS